MGFFHQKQSHSLKNSGFVVSELVVGSGEQDTVYIKTVEGLGTI